MRRESKQQSADERSRLVLVAISRIDATSVFDPSRRHNHLLCPNNLLPGIQTPRVPFWLDPKRPSALNPFCQHTRVCLNYKLSCIEGPTTFYLDFKLPAAPFFLTLFSN